MHDEEFIADDRKELPDKEEAARKNGTKMEGSADTSETLTVPESLSIRGTARIATRR